VDRGEEQVGQALTEAPVVLDPLVAAGDRPAVAVPLVGAGRNEEGRRPHRQGDQCEHGQRTGEPPGPRLVPVPLLRRGGTAALPAGDAPVSPAGVAAFPGGGAIALPGGDAPVPSADVAVALPAGGALTAHRAPCRAAWSRAKARKNAASACTARFSSSSSTRSFGACRLDIESCAPNSRISASGTASASPATSGI